MHENELTYNIVEFDQPVDPDFDLEDWLADMFVNCWLTRLSYNCTRTGGQ
jgi:hypothetical protein